MLLALLAQVEPTVVTTYPGATIAVVGATWVVLAATFKALLSATEHRIEEKFADLRRDVTERKEEAGGMRRELNDLKVEVARSLGDLGSKMPNGELTSAIKALASAAEAMTKIAPSSRPRR